MRAVLLLLLLATPAAASDACAVAVAVGAGDAAPCRGILLPSLDVRAAMDTEARLAVLRVEHEAAERRCAARLDAASREVEIADAARRDMARRLVDASVVPPPPPRWPAFVTLAIGAAAGGASVWLVMR